MGHVLFTLPFMVRSVLAVMLAVDLKTLEEAAASLGASFRDRFFSVILPNVRPGILAGALMVVLDLIGRHPRGWPDWSRAIHLGLWLGLGNLFIGMLILRTARTGKDHYTVAGDQPPGDEPDPSG